MAPPNSSNFSVSVVLPASGWEMMANVRRRWISWVSVSVTKALEGSQAGNVQEAFREQPDLSRQAQDFCHALRPFQPVRVSTVVSVRGIRRGHGVKFVPLLWAGIWRKPGRTILI